MPIYEYKCNSCGHVFEEFQSLGASGNDLKCPECQTPAPDKLFSAFASSNSDSGYSAGSGSSSAGCSSGFG